MLKKLLALTVFSMQIMFIDAQQVKLLTSGKTFSLRGLSVVNDRIIWASGSGGNIGLSTDSGKIWKWRQVSGYEKSDFRDIEAFNDREAVIMGITEPAVILRTTDGGKNWTVAFKDSMKSAFLDAMAFSNDHAIAIGDPLNGVKYLLKSNDRGKSWKRDVHPDIDSMSSGEAYFASSGTNIQFVPGVGYATVSGGKKSRLFINSIPYTLTINQGGETTGANSIAVNPANSNQAFIVGGDFSHDTLRYNNSLQIQFSPFKQTKPVTPPHGYRSCVEYLNNKQMICCGTSGVDLSYDGGMNWTMISDISFHVCRKAKTGKSIFLAGARGVVARLEY
jgi:photosystem II stability/assembly factor-like uncharacterized protein